MITKILAVLFGAIWRFIDGRGWVTGWNVALSLGLPLLCWQVFGNVWQAYTVAVITAISILSGFKSFTWPWAVFNFNYYLNNHVDYHVAEGLYEKANGWHTWHTSYRFLIPALAVCSLTSWNWYWLGATVISGSLFPFTTWLSKKGYIPYYPHKFNEVILGATVIGGLAWV